MYKNNLYKLILVLILLFPISVFAGNEEEKCFELLNDAVSNDSRFNNNTTKEVLVNGDLTKVLYDEVNSSYADLSSYSGFTDNRVENQSPHTELYSSGINQYDFLARRNNIGTIIASGNYTITNIVGFGKNSNFDFPLSAPAGEQSYGDKYKLEGNWFREYVLYTHHNIDGDFMSCGIVKVKPLNDRTFTNISQGNYRTNILRGNTCSSGFEGSKIENGGLEYYKLKSNVCVSDYDDEDYLKMEVISIAYNNNSDYINEYITHQLQVKAMTDLGNNPEGGLKGISDKFMEYLNDKTCLSLIHPTISSLPSSCNGTYSSNLFSYNNIKKNNFNLLSMFIDTAYAKREGLSLEKEVEKSRGMMAYGNIPYDVYKKINSITDKTFKSYILLSIIPNFEDIIDNKKKNNIVITPFEEKFMSCGLNYKKRSEVVIDFIRKLKDTNNIDYKNLSYLDPKFGDCIIPYPDKRNRNKVIEKSFASNKLLAKKLNGTYISPKLSEDIKNNIEKRKKINIDYNDKINSLTKEFNEGKITKKILDEKLIEIKKDFNIKKNDIYNQEKEIKKKIKNEEKLIINEIDKKDYSDKKSINFKTIGLIILFLLIGGIILYITMNKNKE